MIACTWWPCFLLELLVLLKADWNIHALHFQSPHLEPLKEDTLAGTYKSVSPTCAKNSCGAISDCVRSSKKSFWCSWFIHGIFNGTQMHRKSKMSLICCSYCKYFSVFSPLSSLEHPPGAATDVCEGARLWAVSASSQNLHRCHLQPARQPAVCLFFFCLNALVGLRISVIWCSHLKLLQSLPTHT